MGAEGEDRGNGRRIERKFLKWEEDGRKRREEKGRKKSKGRRREGRRSSR